MAKKQRQTPNDPVLSLDGETGTALSEEPVLVTGEEMNADDLLMLASIEARAGGQTHEDRLEELRKLLDEDD